MNYLTATMHSTVAMGVMWSLAAFDSAGLLRTSMSLTEPSGVMRSTTIFDRASARRAWPWSRRSDGKRVTMLAPPFVMLAAPIPFVARILTALDRACNLRHGTRPFAAL
jgi:hypothetical protein